MWSASRIGTQNSGPKTYLRRNSTPEQILRPLSGRDGMVALKPPIAEPGKLSWSSTSRPCSGSARYRSAGSMRDFFARDSHSGGRPKKMQVLLLTTLPQTHSAANTNRSTKAGTCHQRRSPPRSLSPSSARLAGVHMFFSLSPKRSVSHTAVADAMGTPKNHSGKSTIHVLDLQCVVAYAVS